MAILTMALVADSLLLILSTSSSPWASSWDPRIVGIVQFVEANTGLTFRHPVKFEFLGNAAFDRAVTQPSSASNVGAGNQSVEALRAIGLIHGQVNLVSASNQLAADQVIGLYRDDTKTMYVRGLSLTPYVRTTLAHELTHALQDQYFGLSKLQANRPGVDSSAADALVEGQAVRIQNLYQASLSQQDQRLFAEESASLSGGSGPPASVPQVLEDVSSFPYAVGPTYVDALFDSGGNAAIDRAFHDPPVSVAQIIDPSGYPTGWSPAAVEAPPIPKGAHVLSRSSPFGQFMLFEMLGSRLGYQQAWSAVQGWAGDNSDVYRQAGRTCVGIAERMDSAADLATLEGALRSWAAGFSPATVTDGAGQVTVESCDPGPSGPSLPSITPSAFSVLATRSQLIDGAITSGKVSFPIAQCMADRVISTVGPAQLVALNQESVSTSQAVSLVQLVAQATVGCEQQTRGGGST